MAVIEHKIAAIAGIGIVYVKTLIGSVRRTKGGVRVKCPLLVGAAMAVPQLDLRAITGAARINV